MRVSIEKPGTPEELAILHISEKPWSDYTEADYTIEQWHAACLIHLHSGTPTSKSQCKLPVRTPNGALNRNGVHAAAAALAGARSPLKASSVQKTQAASALRRLYSQLDETPPDSLTQSAIDDILEHHGVKGMHWGVRRGEVHPDIAHIPRATRKEAAKDAEEFTRAKLFFGEGAGTRRKLIKASVESKRKKDPLYGEAFDHFVKQTDLGVRAQQARKQRRRTDRRQSNKKAIKKILRETRPLLYQSGFDHSKAHIGQNFVSEFLEHHGVKGMKWGVRKEEPTSSSSRPSKVSGPGVQLATYATLLAAYATFHIIDSGKIKQLRSKRKPIKINKNLSRKNLSIDQLHETVVKPINPDFGNIGTKMNCRRCTFAYEMRRRGLDVKATKSVSATGQSSKGLVEAINPKGSPISTQHKELSRGKWGDVEIGDKDFHKKSGQEKSDEIFKILDKQPNRSRGELAVGWNFGGGHSLAYENIKGKTVIFDTQSGKTFKSSSDLNHLFGNALGEAAYTRLDNADLNMAFLGKWVQNVD